MDVGVFALAEAAANTNLNKENQENRIIWPIFFGGKYDEILLIF